MTMSNSLFSQFGVELEYMIVDGRTLDIRPVADELIRLETGVLQSDAPRDDLEWSNELMLHVIELKTSAPARGLDALAARFQSDVAHINTRLAGLGLRLLPSGMHPWMSPDREARLWPHDGQAVYGAFHRIFDCRGHGWANLQSVHLNLPFQGEEEFCRLHTAIRVLLPLIPALSASSPFAEGTNTGFLDYRLETYRHNCRRIPAITGRVIPEAIRTIPHYHQRILNRIYRALKPHDPEGILCHEWANARGAITRFERDTIEIRIIDVQECPAADLAILSAVTRVLRHLVDASLSPLEDQFRLRTPDLERVFLQALRDGDRARVRSRLYLQALGFADASSMTLGEIWAAWLDRLASPGEAWVPTIRHILRHGCLARRILRATGKAPSRQTLAAVYGLVADCLAKGELFHG